METMEKPQAYNGTEPYIFVSYSHEDSEQAWEIMHLLSSYGYRFWYDDGIHAGANYDDIIAMRIKNAHCFFALLSKNYFESAYCINELNYAYNINLKNGTSKQLLCFLENVSMTDSMEMKYSSIQHLFYYGREKKYFSEKLRQADIISACMIPKPDSPSLEDPLEESLKKSPKQRGERASQKSWVRRHKFLTVLLVLLALFILFLCIPTTPREKSTALTQEGEMFEIRLTADSDITVKEFNHSAAIIEDRIKQIAKKEDYSFDVRDDVIVLSLNKKVIGDSNLGDIVDILKCYVTRPCVPYLYDRETKASIELYPEDFVDPVIGKEREDYIDREEDYETLKFTLSDEAIRRAKEAGIDLNSEHLVFANDVLMTDNWYYFYTYHLDGEGAFCLANEDVGNEFTKLALYNYTHEKSDKAFSVHVILDSLAHWEVAENTPHKGLYQCDLKDLTEPTVTFQLTSYRNTYTNGELLDFETGLKERMDLLEQPYAFGTQEDEEKLIYVVKTGTSRITPEVLDILGKDNTMYFNSINENKMLFFDDNVSVSETENGAPAFEVSMEGDYNLERLMEFRSKVLENGEHEIGIGNSRPLLSVDLEKVNTDGKVIFTDFGWGNHRRPLEEEDRYLLNLIEEVSEHDILPSDLSLGKMDFNSSDGSMAAYKEASDLFLYDGEQEAIIETVHNIDANAEVFIVDNDIKINFKYPVNEELPQKMLSVTKEIGNAISLKDCYSDTISLYFVEENNENLERARFFIRKQNYSEEKPLVYMNGIFCNGRLEPYKEELKALIAQDPYFVILADEDMCWGL